MTGGLPRGRPAQLELLRVRVPLVAPLVSAHGTELERWSILVRALAPDGTEGWGESPALLRPTYTSEWHWGSWRVLCEMLGPAAVRGEVAGIVGHPMAELGIETALVDLALRQQGIPLATVLGSTSRSVSSCAVVGIAPTVEELLGRVAEKLAMGHRAVKLKIRPGWDLEPLSAVRSTWPEVSLAADANASYAGEPWDQLSRLDTLELAYLEQPLAADDLVGHAELRRQLSTPLALDESATSIGAVRAALALGAAGALNLKPARLGGLWRAREVHDLVAAEGLPAWCGGMIELGVGRSAALAVAALPGCTLPTDLGPTASYVERDVTEAVELDAEGRIPLPQGAGIGRTPDPGRLDEVVVERHLVRPG